MLTVLGESTNRVATDVRRRRPVTDIPHRSPIRPPPVLCRSRVLRDANELDAATIGQVGDVRTRLGWFHNADGVQRRGQHDQSDFALHDIEDDRSTKQRLKGDVRLIPAGLQMRNAVRLGLGIEHRAMQIALVARREDSKNHVREEAHDIEDCQLLQRFAVISQHLDIDAARVSGVVDELLVFLAAGQWPSEWLQRLGERDADMTIARRDIVDNELLAVFERHVERS